jgi:hypothetical protein
MRGFLDAVAARLQPALLGDVALERLRAAAALLPESAGTSLFGFEVALGHDRAECDFLVSFSTAENGPRLLREAASSPERAADPAWCAVARFATRWGAELRDRIDDVWLEFDIGSDHPRSPSLFFRPVGAAGDRYESLDAALASLLDERLRASVRLGLTRHGDRLREHGSLFQVGVLLPRAAPGVRLCLMMERDKAAHAVQALGLAVDRDLLDAIARPFEGVRAHGALDVDLAQDLLPSVGFESYLQPRLQTAATLSANGLLHALARRRLVTPARIAALQAYVGTQYPGPGEPWPEVVEAGRRLAQDRQWSCLVRYLHHVKVSFGAHGASAKGYLAVQHLWRNVGALEPQGGGDSEPPPKGQ